MAFDRNRKEQEALSALGKGDIDKAANLYSALLKHDPRDRRVRQKLSDLYLRIGKKEEAEKHLRELTKLYTSDGNNRAAIAVYKKLLPLAPNDYGLLVSMGDSFLKAGFTNDAISNFEQAINGMEHRAPLDAAAAAKKLLALRPGDTPLRIKTAELFAAGRKNDEAFEVYQEVIAELRRRGRVDEVGRLAIEALKLGKQADDLLQDAAESCLASGDPQGALHHLQVAYQSNPGDSRTLDLLARSFEAGDEPEKARPVLVALSKVLARERRYSDRVPVLERAIACGAASAELTTWLAEAKVAEELALFRLTDLTDAAPQSEEEVRQSVRLTVLARYDMGEKALDELSELTEELQKCPAMMAVEAEIRIGLQQIDAALELAGLLRAKVGAEGQDKVDQRVAVLKGGDLSRWIVIAPPEEEEVDDAELLDSALDDDDVIDDGLIPDEDELLLDSALEGDDDELLGELLGDEDEITEEEPEEAPAPAKVSQTPEEISATLDDLLGSGDEEDKWVEGDDAGQTVLSDEEYMASLLGGETLEVDPDDLIEEPDEPAATGGDGVDLEEIEGMISLGMIDEAVDVLEDLEGLKEASLLARCYREKGKVKRAISALRDAIDDAEESDPAMPAALFELADLMGRAKKHRAALRYLRELQEIAPSFNAKAVALRVKALKSVLGK